MNNKISILFIAFMGLFQTANAAPGDMAVGLKAGTLGAGLELTLEAANRVNVRFGGNYFKINRTVDVEGNDYDLDLKLQNFTALADWYITDGSFRITAGAVLNQNGLKGTALESNTFEIDDTIYTSAEVGVLNADVDFKSVAPYIGIGWGNPLSDDSDWSFMADLGVVFAGKPRLDIMSTGGTLSNDPGLEASLVQTEADFADSDELNYLKFHPVISIGLNYRF